ncbi:Uncharacterised protein [Acinetobacter baumannii]|nr:Uncharacterised protein [Acinetobacter baumannii]
MYFQQRAAITGQEPLLFRAVQMLLGIGGHRAVGGKDQGGDMQRLAAAQGRADDDRHLMRLRRRSERLQTRIAQRQRQFGSIGQLIAA